MSARLKKNWELLQLLQRHKNHRERKALLFVGKDDLIRALCEIIHNVLEGTIELNAKEKASLKRYKRSLRQLVDKKVSKASKREILNKKGGFLPIVLAPALSLVASLIGEAIGKNI